MVNRILEILRHKNLTASKFADEIGVQRSSISHILSERNKPSLELIQKILNTYTEISSEWLLTGKNTMISGQVDLFSQTQIPDIKNSKIIEKEETVSPITYVNNQSSQINKDGFTENDTFVNNQNSTTKEQEIKHQLFDSSIATNKLVERIIIFYNDRTFKEYLPE